MFDLMSFFTLDLQAVGFDCVSSSPVTGYWALVKEFSLSYQNRDL